MSTVTAVHLRSVQDRTRAAYETARGAAHGALDLVEAAWIQCREDTRLAIDTDAGAAVASKFHAIFDAFSRLNLDENARLKRPVLDRHPALAAWMVEVDERMAQLQTRIDASAANAAERHREQLPAMHLERIRAAGFDLFVDAKGRLMAAPGAPLDQGHGVAIYTERKAEFVALLRAEAEAAAADAKRLGPVVIA